MKVWLKRNTLKSRDVMVNIWRCVFGLFHDLWQRLYLTSQLTCVSCNHDWLSSAGGNNFARYWIIMSCSCGGRHVWLDGMQHISVLWRACHTDIQLASISTRLALLIFRSNFSFMLPLFFSGEAQLVGLCTKAVLALGPSNHIRIDFGQDSRHHRIGNDFPAFHVTWVVRSFCLLLPSHPS